MERITTFGNRMKQFMLERDNMTYDQLSCITGYPAQTLNRYALGQRIPKITDFSIIASKMDVNPLWLQGYDVEEKPTPVSGSEPIDPLDAHLMDLLQIATPEQKKAWISLLENLGHRE